MDPLTDWLAAPKPDRQALIAALSSDHAEHALNLVRAPERWGVYASLGPNFQYAIFGRDSIETAEDILAFDPDTVHDIILKLCYLQGTTNTTTEEEPGKIHHEFRAVRLNGHDVPERSIEIIRRLQRQWGGEGTDEMIYYGSHDATPLFVRLVGRYCDRAGSGILDETVTRRGDGETTVRDCLRAALGWLETKISDHSLGLFVQQRLNPNGIVNQAWKDSPTSYLHLDGTLPGYDSPVASIELQGYAYDALLTGMRLHLGSPEDRERWGHLAQQLQRQTVQLLWMEDAQYFAQALDFTNPAEPRQIATITSNPGALLDSGLLHDLPGSDARRFSEAIMHTVMGPELLTTIGVRCRAVKHWDLQAFIDYHGPNTVWPKETYDIAKGLRRAGLHHEAGDLEDRLMAGLKEAGEFAEFFYVSRSGKVWYDTAEAMGHFSAQSQGHDIPVPEPAQAWTIAAALAISRRRA
ncbi:MAG TPA: hypothetical protein VLF40_04920 [Candidatus Saccharimonadales bacterium]|nr:hypothetical protein [Candidatus Saccharimonadales bacterium]